MAIRYLKISLPTPQAFDPAVKTLSNKEAMDEFFQWYDIITRHIGSNEKHYGGYQRMMHQIFNSMFGDGEISIPLKYTKYDGQVEEITDGRESITIVNKDGKIRHAHLKTYVMPDGEVHVLMLDIEYV